MGIVAYVKEGNILNTLVGKVSFLRNKVWHFPNSHVDCFGGPSGTIEVLANSLSPSTHPTLKILSLETKLEKANTEFHIQPLLHNTGLHLNGLTAK